MRTSSKVLLILALIVSATSLTFLTAPSAQALPEPSFEVVCFPTKMAKIDPIVFPKQPGKSHMHTIFGAKNLTASSNLTSLLRHKTSQCGKNYDKVDRSGYWVPTLYKNGKSVYTIHGSIQLRIYYKRAGGPTGAKVRQAFPRGLRMVAGNAMATTPQDHVGFKCANTIDTGTQSKWGSRFPSCTKKETLIAQVTFPDCWDGKHLDATDHKSHMAYSGGAHATCPKSHPVKLPQITFEVWYYGVHGPAKDFKLASGGPYTMHGDVMSAWREKPAAQLVDECINKAVMDCNPPNFDQIPLPKPTAWQMRVQGKVKPPAMLTVAGGAM